MSSSESDEGDDDEKNALKPTSGIAALRLRLIHEKEKKKKKMLLSQHSSLETTNIKNKKQNADDDDHDEIKTSSAKAIENERMRFREERAALREVIGELSEENASLMAKILKTTTTRTNETKVTKEVESVTDFEKREQLEKRTNLMEKRAKEFQRQKEAAEQARGEDANRFSQKLSDLESIKQRLSQQLREARETIEKRDKEVTRLREHLLDVEEADDRDEIAIEERVEIEKKKALENFENGIEILRTKLQMSEESLLNKQREVENLNRALGSFYADQEQIDGKTNDAKEARQKLSQTTAKLRETSALLEKKTAEIENLENTSKMMEEKFKDMSRKCSEATAQSTKLRVALTQAIKKIARLSSSFSSRGVDSEVFIDKAVITKLLVTYFERGFSEEVLELMARLLDMEGSQRDAILSGARRATRVISKVARAPLGIARGFGKAFGVISGAGLRVVGATGEHAEVPVADLFIEFLLREAEEELSTSRSGRKSVTLAADEKENSPTNESKEEVNHLETFSVDVE